MKRFRLIAPFVFALALALGALTGCGPSAADLIRTDITEQLDEIAAHEDGFIEELADASGESFQALGIDPATFAEAYLDGFSYEIGDITVEDTTAEAQVTLTVKSLSSIISSFQTRFSEEIAQLDAASAADEQGLYTLAGQLIMEAVEGAEPAESSFSVTYTKDEDGEWSTTDDAETAMMNALLS